MQKTSDVERRGRRSQTGGADLQKQKSWCGRKDSNLHGIATASPSSWCVCQFRHFRKQAGIAASKDEAAGSEAPANSHPDSTLTRTRFAIVDSGFANRDLGLRIKD